METSLKLTIKETYTWYYTKNKQTNKNSDHVIIKRKKCIKCQSYGLGLKEEWQSKF